MKDEAKESMPDESFLILSRVAAEAVFDAVVDDEIQLLRREPVVPSQHRVYFVEDGFGLIYAK